MESYIGFAVDKKVSIGLVSALQEWLGTDPREATKANGDNKQYGGSSFINGSKYKMSEIKMKRSINPQKTGCNRFIWY
jgi:hypothetical protein